MAPTSLKILELPGADGFVHGYYGLEECSVRGFVRIERTVSRPLRIRQLRINLRGLLWTRFYDAVDQFDMVRREKVLFDQTVELLTNAEIAPTELSDGAHLDIPFEVPFPLHEPVTAGHGPALQLLPPSSTVFGKSSSLHFYQACTEYSVTAVLVEATSSRTGSTSIPAPSSTSTVFGLNTRSGDAGTGPAGPSSLFLSGSGDTSSATGGGTGASGGILSLSAAALGLSASLFGPPVRTCTLPITPFLVYDPRMLPILMHPDPRRWRSSPGAIPVEYDIEVGSVALGSGDPIRFAYRMVVHGDSARQGVRVQRVTFILKETHIVGEDRCCALDDRPRMYAVHKPPARVKGVAELIRWEHVEYDPAVVVSMSQSVSASSGFEFAGAIHGGNSGTGEHGASASALSSQNVVGALGSVGRSSYGVGSFSGAGSIGGRPRSISNGSINSSANHNNPDSSLSMELTHLREPQKLVETISRPGTHSGANDGVYVENETLLHVPSIGGFTPTTAKPVIPPDDAICHMIRPRNAILQVRHSIQVMIDFIGAERISIESGVYLLSVGQKECTRTLEIDPEILPTLDYDKVVGIEVWVPEYHTRDPLFDELADTSHATSRIPSHVFSIDESVSGDLFVDAQENVDEHESDGGSDVPDSPTPRYENVVPVAPPPSEDTSAIHSGAGSPRNDQLHFPITSSIFVSDDQGGLVDGDDGDQDDVDTVLDRHDASRFQIRRRPRAMHEQSPSVSHTQRSRSPSTRSQESRSMLVAAAHRRAHSESQSQLQPQSPPLSQQRIEPEYISNSAAIESTIPITADNDNGHISARRLDDELDMALAEPMDPLTRFAAEPPTIMPLEDAIAEAMNDMLVLNTQTMRQGHFHHHTNTFDNVNGTDTNYDDGGNELSDNVGVFNRQSMWFQGQWPMRSTPRSSTNSRDRHAVGTVTLQPAPRNSVTRK